MGTAFAEAEYTEEVTPNAVMLIDADTGKVLYSNDKDNESIWPASTTKILTCIIALERCSLDEEVTISSKAADFHRGSLLGMKAGEKMSLEDLLIGMMLPSGNDAAIAVAEHVSESVDSFVTVMNDYASDLGMNDSHFANPNGLHDENHFVTISDMAKLAQHAFKNETFMDIVGRESYDMPASNKTSHVDNSNLLLRKDKNYYYKYATGIKTGSTREADNCVVASASKDGLNLICLIYGDDGDEDGTARWPTAKNLFEWGFDNYETVELSSLLGSTEAAQIQVEGYASNDPTAGLLTFDVADLSNSYITLDKDVADKIRNGTVTIEPKVTTNTANILAPVSQGNVLGTLEYVNSETSDVYYHGDLIAPRDVLESGSEGDTPVVTVSPILIIDDGGTGGGYAWFLLIIPGGLIAFLVIRLMSVNKRKRSRRFNRRRPHYSYKIKK